MSKTVLARGRQGLGLTDEGRIRIQGLETDPNSHAAVLTIELGLLLYFFYCTPSKKWRFLSGGVLFLFFVNCVGSGSRSTALGFIACVVPFVAFFDVSLKKKVLFITGTGLALMCVVLGMVVFFPNVSGIERFTRPDTAAGRDLGVSFRKDMLLVSWQMARDHFILGIGTGNFSAEYFRYLRHAPFLTKKSAIVPHNTFMGVFAENGIFGLTVYALFFLSVLREAFLSMRRASDARTRLMALGIFSSLVAFLYCENIYPVWGSKLGMTVMALSAALYRCMSREASKAVTDSSHTGFLDMDEEVKGMALPEQARASSA
jgi:O-antigen ligase